MPGPVRSRSTVRFVLATALAVVLVAARLVVPGTDAAALSRWTGGIDLYRSGVFTTQKTWLWCTAADVQIIRNIADGATDHSRSSQSRYFDYMRAHDRYAIPVSDGTDPGGWTAGLRHFVDGRYQLYQSSSFDSALRSAVTNLRKTNLPVAITVSHGNHAWVITGFTATADPAVTTGFSVTSVRVVGPLWGLQSRSYGYDMRPDTKLTPAQLKGFFTPWHYAGVRMAWEGLWVSVQPVAKETTTAAAPKPTARPTPRPTPKATPEPAATPVASPYDAASATPSASASASAPDLLVARAEPIATATFLEDPAASTPEVPTGEAAPVGVLAGVGLILVSILVVAGGAALRVRSRR